jgi:hypothetical protein
MYLELNRSGCGKMMPTPPDPVVDPHSTICLLGLGHKIEYTYFDRNV